MSAIPWTRDAASHLLRRAGFGGTPAEIDALYATGSVEAAVSSLVDDESIDTSAYEAALAAKNYNLTTIKGVQQWFLDRMAFSPRRLEEKMTYFWNLHWTSGISKVKGVTLILNQNKTERQYALGKFDDMVVHISQDPAMLVWLDNWLSRPTKPNENYARELMELFTLGVSSGYTQSDVTNVARALSGWTLQNYSKTDTYNGATFVDNAAFHDNGSKVILGQTGNWNGYDALQIILNWSDAQGSKSGRFLAAKLWTYLGYPYPADYLVGQLASVYDSSGRSVRELVRAILSSPEFYEPHTLKTWVRSPVEYAVASVRMLEGTSDFSSAVNSLTSMGQPLFDPQDAKGWDWGDAWMNTGTVFARASLSNSYISNRNASGTFLNPSALLSGQDASTADAVVDILADRLNVSDVSSDVRSSWVAYLNANDDGSRGVWSNTPTNVDKKVRGLVDLMLTSSAFHMA
jgi:uncharacterized protein (DUF1800 family)